MQCQVLQKLTTVRGDMSQSSITQDVEDHVLVLDGADATFITDVHVVTVNAGAGVMLVFESNASNDGPLWSPITPPIPLAPTAAPLVTKTARGAASLVGLGRSIRYRLYTVGSVTGTWDATFRARVAVSRSAFFTPPQLAGNTLWLRSDLGIPSGTLPGASATFASGKTWGDQGPHGNNATSVGAVPYGQATANGIPGLGLSGSTSYFSGSGANWGPTHTLFVVGTYSGNTGLCCAFAATQANTADTAFSQLTLATSTDPVGRMSITGTNLDQSSGAAAPTIPTIYSTAGSQAYGVDLAVNGVSYGPTTGLTPGVPDSFLVLAQAVSGGNAVSPMQGTVYEVILYNRVLSAAERIIVTRYLGGRYGIAVP